MKARPLKKRNEIFYAKFTFKKDYMVVAINRRHSNGAEGTVVESSGGILSPVGYHTNGWSYGVNPDWTILQDYTPKIK